MRCVTGSGCVTLVCESGGVGSGLVDAWCGAGCGPLPPIAGFIAMLLSELLPCGIGWGCCFGCGVGLLV